MEKTVSHWVITINQIVFNCTYLFEREVVLFNTYFRIKKNRDLLKPSAECIECYCIDLDLSIW